MQNNMDKAYAYYMRVIKEHPGSNYVAGSMLQAGNIQNKKGQYDAALNMLNDLYNKFPKSNEAFESVNITHELWKKKGDTDCLEKLRDLKGSNITASKLGCKRVSSRYGASSAMEPVSFLTGKA